ncbi:hypothetical protein DEU56DRAFT_917860 [Suillus clintonianus]|uniref:uncharacterized protein n=1 Tax=Suillus clintonianus TaxID=1904413 RepID=UPI001B86B9D0|nr:uncharacterized protein DEU56DRAFT_917860 [Suillus clintonianus]KAG2122213.1 hypothetical protein DEU56DRAFT_917860 [Suillus clintonianus]
MDQQDHFSLPQNTCLISAPTRRDMDAEPSHHSTVEACQASVMTANPPTGVTHAPVQATTDLVLPYFSPVPSTVQFEVPFGMQGHYFEQEFLEQALVGTAEEISVKQGNHEQDGDDDVLEDIGQLRFSIDDYPDHPIITWPQGPLAIEKGSMAEPLSVIGQHISSIPATQTVAQAIKLKLNSKTPGASPLPKSTQDTVSSRVVEWRFQSLYEPPPHSRQRDADAT